MNRRVLITSLVSILALMLVLVIGRTENASEPKPAQNSAGLEPKPQTNLNTNVAIPGSDARATIWQSNTLSISSEVNESDIILERERLPARISNQKPEYLTNSLRRLQLALDGLERAAANAEQAVKAIEHQISSG